MINHIFISFSADRMYKTSYIHLYLNINSKLQKVPRISYDEYTRD